MLVLSRKQQQEIIVGDNVKITVLKIKGNTVRLGIEAPRDVRVVRGELPMEGDSQEAGLTVVFNDFVETTKEVESIPFRSKDKIRPPRSDRSPRSPKATGTRTKDSMVLSTQGNRLIEIVREISGK
jgi:carbon storage regulator CsrA